MLYFMIPIEGAWDRDHHYDTQLFSKMFCILSLVSAFKVSNNLDKHLPRHSIFKDCLESDVHHMTSLTDLINFD